MSSTNTNKANLNKNYIETLLKWMQYNRHISTRALWYILKDILPERMITNEMFICNVCYRFKRLMETL